MDRHFGKLSRTLLPSLMEWDNFLPALPNSITLPRLTYTQVKVQTSPGYAKGLTDGLPKFIAQEGFSNLFRGVVPLWCRQIPYTMVKFGE